MKIQVREKLSEEDFIQIINIMRREFPAVVVNQGKDSFNLLINDAVNPKHFIYRADDGSIAGWLITFDRDSERFFIMLVKAEYQSKGIGSSLICEMKKYEDAVVGWVIESEMYDKTDGSAYRSPINFYLKNGFVVTNETITKNNVRTVKLKWVNGKI